MINGLRSSHPFFFGISSFVLMLAYFPVYKNDAFFFVENHPLSVFSFIPYYVQYLFGISILFYSGLLINHIVNKSVLFNRNFYLPGLIYISLMLFIPLNGSLHPMAISNLFSILCFENLIKVYRNESCKNHIFKACCWIMLAVFCFPSFCILYLIPWITLLIIRPFIWKEYLMPIISLIFFSVYIISYLFLFNPDLNLLQVWLSSLDFYVFKIHFEIVVLLSLFLFMTLVLSFKIILLSYGRSTNRFKKVMKLLIIYFVLCVCQMGIDFFVFKSNTISIYSTFVPISILISFVFMYGKRLWIIDSAFIIYVFGLLLVTYLI